MAEELKEMELDDKYIQMEIEELEYDHRRERHHQRQPIKHNVIIKKDRDYPPDWGDGKSTFN